MPCNLRATDAVVSIIRFHGYTATVMLSVFGVLDFKPMYAPVAFRDADFDPEGKRKGKGTEFFDCSAVLRLQVKLARKVYNLIPWWCGAVGSNASGVNINISDETARKPVFFVIESREICSRYPKALHEFRFITIGKVL